MLLWSWKCPWIIYILMYMWYLQELILLVTSHQDKFMLCVVITMHCYIVTYVCLQVLAIIKLSQVGLELPWGKNSLVLKIDPFKKYLFHNANGLKFHGSHSQSFGYMVYWCVRITQNLLLQHDAIMARYWYTVLHIVMSI